MDLPQFQKYENKRKNAKNPIVKEEERITDILKKLRKENKISENLYDVMKPVGSQPPRLYGLAKVHKDDCPVRPVVSMPGSPYHRVAQQVAFWLSHVPECKINSNTKDIRDSLKDINLDESECLVSFDIVSLYTNVPVREAIEVCADLLFKHIDIPVDKETFITLAELASCDVIFSTHDGYFKQIDGLAMGSAPAPHLANGWLSSFDNVIKGNASLYFRYMDDILTKCVKNEVGPKLQAINNLHPSLSFTVEHENDGKLPFLDMIIYNNNGCLSSGWYRKPTDTGLTLNFHSLSPMKYKRSVVIGFVYRIYRSCSTWNLFHTAIMEAREILTNNQYPPSFIDDLMNKTLTKLLSSDDDDKEVQDSMNASVNEEIVSENEEDVSENDVSLDPNAYSVNLREKDKFKFFMNYRGKPSEKFARSLRKLNAPCKIIMTLHKTKQSLPSLKVKVPKMLQSNVVYKITCPRCDSSYVGQTTRHVQQRFREHLGKLGIIKKHCEDCDISPSNDMIKILGRAKGERLLTLEALFILSIQPSLNTKDEYRSRTLKLKF